MTTRVFVLPTQNDILDFRLGLRPETILVRDFQTRAELAAYEQGVAASGDAYDSIRDIQVNGPKVVFTRRSEDPEIEAGVAETAEAAFATPDEAQAFCHGIADAEGLAAPLLIDDTDDRFEQLQDWSSAESDCLAG